MSAELAVEAGSVELVATEPTVGGDGVIRAVVTARRDGEILHRSRVNLTSDRERARYLTRVEELSGESIGGALLAIEESIRQDPPNPDLSAASGGQGTRIALSDPDPWPDSVDGPLLLGDIEGTYTRYIGLPPGAAVALTLWTMHAHAHDAADVSPLLAPTSPEKRCGKTTTLNVLGALVPRPLPASNVTAAALFRVVEALRPTLLVDEADTFLRDREDLRGVLNSGHTRASALVVRTTGDDHEVRVFTTWAPKAVAMIGDLPDTLADRSIIVPMRRRHPDEDLDRLRLDRLSELEPLRRQAARWARDHMDRLRGADPDVPGGLHDRAADNWRPLLAIADAAGGVWPDRAREAARILSGAQDGDDGSVRTLLLRDLRDLFARRGAERIASSEITTALAEREDRPWGEWGRSRKPITPHSLARLLKPFGVGPTSDGLERGYRRETFEEAWSRYLPRETPTPDRQTVRTPMNERRDPEIESVSTGDAMTLAGSRRTPASERNSDGLTLRAGGLGNSTPGVEPDWAEETL